MNSVICPHRHENHFASLCAVESGMLLRFHQGCMVMSLLILCPIWYIHYPMETSLKLWWLWSIWIHNYGKQSRRGLWRLLCLVWNGVMSFWRQTWLRRTALQRYKAGSDWRMIGANAIEMWGLWCCPSMQGVGLCSGMQRANFWPELFASPFNNLPPHSCWADGFTWAYEASWKYEVWRMRRWSWKQIAVYWCKLWLELKSTLFTMGLLIEEARSFICRHGEFKVVLTPHTANRVHHLLTYHALHSLET